MEARPFQISPMGTDVITKQKGQWLCHKLGQEKKIGKPEMIVLFGIECFFQM